MVNVLPIMCHYVARYHNSLRGAKDPSNQYPMRGKTVPVLVCWRSVATKEIAST